MAAHDLRTPLGVIAMKTQAMRRLRLDGSLHADWVRDLDLMLRHISYMDRLIHDLLDLAQLQAGKLTVHRTREDLLALLDQAIESIRPMAEGRHLSLESCAALDAENMVCWVRCDKQRVFQVMANLLGNAIKFTAATGSIVVRISRCRLGFQVEVQDDGIGIEAAALPHIFRRYWRAGQGAARAAEHGAGLGLYIARTIVKAHGGYMWVQSVPGRGSTFYFTLPALVYT